MGFFDNLFGKKPNSNERNNNFVLTGIERKNINGQEYAFQYVNFKKQKMPLVGLISAYNAKYVEYSSKRPIGMQPPNGQIGYTSLIPEFFSDLLTINSFLNDESILNDNSFINVAEFICNKHIKRAGRLIDTDLYTYVDLIIISKNGIWNKLNNYQITDTEAATLWTELTNHCKARFENYIYLTKFDMSNTLQPKPYLVKMKN